MLRYCVSISAVCWNYLLHTRDERPKVSAGRRRGKAVGPDGWSAGKPAGSLLRQGAKSVATFNWATWATANFTCPMLATTAYKCTYLPSLTGPRDASDIEAMRIIHFEVLFDDGALSFALPRYRREQILGIDLILQLLVAVKIGFKFSSGVSVPRRNIFTHPVMQSIVSSTGMIIKYPGCLAMQMPKW